MIERCNLLVRAGILYTAGPGDTGGAGQLITRQHSLYWAGCTVTHCT